MMTPLHILPALALAVATTTAHAQPSLRLLSRHSTGIWGASAAEIPAFDPHTTRVFVVNGAAPGVDAFDLDATGTLNHLATLPIPTITVPGKINSVAVSNAVMAVAVADNLSNQAPGSVHFFCTITLEHLASITVGPLPDMLVFTPDAARLLVANEGEPNSYNQPDSIDPEGSITIIDVSFPAPGRVDLGPIRTARFDSFNPHADALRAAGVRIIGPGSTVAQDLEPEYIAVSPDSSTAYVTLQENNALAIIDIDSATVRAILHFPLKDHSLPNHGLDPSDRDGSNDQPDINIVSAPVRGMPQPDAIAVYEVLGQTYLVTANEGDARDYPGLREQLRVGSPRYRLDPAAFPDADALKADSALGRLNASTSTGDLDHDGDFDQIHAFGTRSFSIWRPDATLVYDSADDFEQITARRLPHHFNADGTNNTPDARSDNSGPEPEGLAIGHAFGRTLAFIGLERVGGIMMYDITAPHRPIFLDYINTRDFSASPGQDTLPNVGDISPEGLCFIPAHHSPTATPLLIVAFELSGTTCVFEITESR